MMPNIHWASLLRLAGARGKRLQSTCSSRKRGKLHPAASECRALPASQQAWQQARKPRTSLCMTPHAMMHVCLHAAPPLAAPVQGSTGRARSPDELAVGLKAEGQQVRVWPGQLLKRGDVWPLALHQLVDDLQQRMGGWEQIGGALLSGKARERLTAPWRGCRHPRSAQGMARQQACCRTAEQGKGGLAALQRLRRSYGPC